MSTASPFSCVLWDVDGTIVDASGSILRRLSATLGHFGYPEPTRAELAHWIGPPMHQSMQENLGMTADDAAAAVAYYRELGRSEGYTKDVVTFRGVAELIAELHEAGVAQGVASSKPERQVRVLMDHFALTGCFVSITGATDDERTLATKSDIVGEELRRLASAGVDVSRPVLVGDRHHDIEGGAEHGVPVIFVRWGFSWPHEAEGAAWVVDDVDELRALLLVGEGGTVDRTADVDSMDGATRKVPR